MPFYCSSNEFETNLSYSFADVSHSNNVEQHNLQKNKLSWTVKASIFTFVFLMVVYSPDYLT
jgi:hypothetical protein